MRIRELFKNRKYSEESKFTDKIPLEDALLQISLKVANSLVPLIPNEEDLWLFFVDQYMMMQDYDNQCERIFAILGLKVHKVEYNFRTEGEIGAAKNSDAVNYLNHQVIPMLTGQFDRRRAELIACNAFCQYCLQYRHFIHNARVNFAERFARMHRSAGNSALADRWQNVVTSLNG